MTDFERKLKLLFDAQDFFRNPRLDAMIRNGMAQTLSDDELEFLSAAGDPFAAPEKEDARGDG